MDMITLKIQERRYGMRKMPPMQGARFTARVVSLVSKAASGKDALKTFEMFRSVLPSDMEKNEEQKKETSLDAGQAITIGSSILGLFSTIDPDQLMDIFKEAFSYEVYCGDVKLSDEMSLDIHFQKFPGDFYIVALWVTYNQAKDFFTGFGDGIKALFPAFELKKG